MTLTIKRPEKDVPLCLDASLRAEWEDAQRRLADALKQPADGRMTGNAAATALADEVGEIEQQMAAETVTFRLRGMRRDAWSAKVAAHPPRKDHAADKQYAINVDTFFDDVMIESLVAVLRDGEPIKFDAASEWKPLADEMTNGQYSEFVDALLDLNRGAAGIPFSRAAASLRNRTPSETSE